jgi:Flp pilus assembly protein TadB
VELQEVFYTLGIIYMTIMLLITIALLIGVFIIKKRIDEIHQRIEEKLAVVTNAARVGSNLVNAAKRVAGRG